MAIVILPKITFFGLIFKLPTKTKLNAKKRKAGFRFNILISVYTFFLEKNDTMTHSTNDTRGGDGRRLDR